MALAQPPTVSIMAIQLTQLEQMLQAERGLKESAERRAKDAYDALYHVAQSFCSEELDARLRANKGQVKAWTPDELSTFITENLSARMNRMMAGDEIGSLYEQAQKDREELGRQLDAEQEANADLSARVESLELRLATAQQALADANRRLDEAQRASIMSLAQPQPRQESLAQSQPRQETLFEEPTDAGSVPGKEAAVAALRPDSPGAWFEEWRAANTFERDKDIIWVLGSTGLCRRPVIFERLAEMWDVTPKTASLRRAIERCDERGLIGRETPSVGRIGRSPEVIKLTTRGQNAFMYLFEQEPVDSLFDQLMVRHKSEAHTLLNLEGADVLRNLLAAKVDLFPAVIQLEGGREFSPDLVATLADGQTIYVECERDTRKNAQARDRKWKNYYDATGGKMYLICPDPSSRKALVSEINAWLRFGTRLALRATDITTLRTQPDPFWIYDRPDLGVPMPRRRKRNPRR